MEGAFPNNKFPNALKNEHLIKGVNPIMVSVGTLKDWEKSGSPEQNIYNNFGLKNIEEIKWNSSARELDAKGFLHAGFGTYVISTINSRNKALEAFNPCLGLVIAGREKDSDKEISFAVHILPALTSEETYKFIADLHDRLNQIKELCVVGTFDALIFGGKGFDLSAVQRKEAYRNYLRAVQGISMQVKKGLGFEPVVANGPKFPITRDNSFDCAYYDNDNRRLYLIRPEVNQEKDFIASEIIKTEK